MSDFSQNPSAEQPLSGERIALVGRLSGMSRGDARQIILSKGGQLADSAPEMPTVIVIGDDQSDLKSALASDRTAPESWEDGVSDGRIKLLKESELWEWCGLVDQAQGIQRHYTPAMLAELVDVPILAVRRWYRDNHLRACRHVRRLPYFDFPEVAIAGHLAALYHAGSSLRTINRKLAELEKLLPEVDRPLADPALVVEGQQLLLRRGEELAEPGGQLLIDFEKPDEAVEEPTASLQISVATEPDDGTDQETPLSTLEEMLQAVQEWEDQGELDQAVEAYRALLFAGHQTPEIHFALADLLYRMGDLAAARERYYVAIEMDEEYVEARASLGCVLVESNELELARAAFEGALAFHPDYADVHYHLASLLDKLGSRETAEAHWHQFLELAPESPWAAMARDRLEVVRN